MWMKCDHCGRHRAFREGPGGDWYCTWCGHPEEKLGGFIVVLLALMVIVVVGVLWWAIK